MGRLLELGEEGARTVRRWEARGDATLPGPVSVAVSALRSGWRPGDRGIGEVKRRCREALSAFLQGYKEHTEHIENGLQAALDRINQA